MSEYIGRTALMGKLTAADMQQKLRQMSGEDAYRVLLWLVNDAPAADVAPVVHGKWIFGVPEVLGTSVRCSVCGWSAPIVDADMWLRYPGHHFCGACGAKMDGKGE